MPSHKLIIPGDLLRRLRLEAVLSRAALAKEANISPATVKAIETGESGGVRPETVRAIAKVLGCEPASISQVIPEEAAS